jgi:cytochrome c biogenesis protein CcdA
MLSPKLLLTLLLLALADCLNPTLFAIQIYLLTTPEPAPKGLAFALGVFTSAMLGSSVLVFGLWRWILLGLNTFSGWTFLLQRLLGLLLLGLGLLPHRLFQTAPKPVKKLGLGMTFFAGMMATASDVTALPLLVATEQLTQAKLGWWQNLLILMAYNIIYASPLLLMVILFQRYGQKLMPRFQQFNAWINRIFPWLLRALTAAVGLLLLVASFR